MPSYLLNVYTNGPLEMAFYMDLHRQVAVSGALKNSGFFNRSAIIGTEEVEVAAFVGLADMVGEHVAVTAFVAHRRRRPGLAPNFHFSVGNVERQGAVLHIDGNHVAGIHQR